jgi:hypothetical protein
MTRPELTALFGILALVVSLLAVYVAYHPTADYQRERLANTSEAGTRRKRIGAIALVVVTTGFAILIGLVFPMSSK